MGLYWLLLLSTFGFILCACVCFHLRNWPSDIRSVWLFQKESKDQAPSNAALLTDFKSFVVLPKANMSSSLRLKNSQLDLFSGL